MPIPPMPVPPDPDGDLSPVDALVVGRSLAGPPPPGPLVAAGADFGLSPLGPDFDAAPALPDMPIPAGLVGEPPVTDDFGPTPGEVFVAAGLLAAFVAAGFGSAPGFASAEDFSSATGSDTDSFATACFAATGGSAFEPLASPEALPAPAASPATLAPPDADPLTAAPEDPASATVSAGSDFDSPAGFLRST